MTPTWSKNGVMRHVISLGAGVQSSCMALMAARGEITPMPEFAIFADTGWEPDAVYSWLAWLKSELPFPVVTVSAGNIRDAQVNNRVRGNVNNSRWACMPYFTLNQDSSVGKTRRQCTAEYKIEPIEKYLRREVLELKKRQRAPKTPVITQWRGISTDEASRMKPSREPWMVVRYPLAMELGMSRGDCLNWFHKCGLPRPPRSACIGCPYHSNDEWRDMKNNRPLEWADAVDFDKRIRKAGGMRGETFLHRQCVPLDEVDLRNDLDRGQHLLSNFAGECEGMCGL